MTFLSECAGLAVGIPVIKCASAATDYVFGWSAVIVLLLIVFFNLDAETTKDRVAVTILVNTVVIGILVVFGLLPENAFTWAAMAGVGALVVQVFTKT